MKNRLLIKRNLFLLLSSLFLLCSCSTTSLVPIQPELEHLFMGRTKAEIIEILGSPDRVSSDGKGGQILIYEEIVFRKDISKKLYSNDFSKGFSDFYLNSDNLCYAVKSNKQVKERHHSKGKTVGLVVGLTGGLLVIAAGVVAGLADY